MKATIIMLNLKTFDEILKEYNEYLEKEYPKIQATDEMLKDEVFLEESITKRVSFDGENISLWVYPTVQEGSNYYWFKPTSYENIMIKWVNHLFKKKWFNHELYSDLSDMATYIYGKTPYNIA